MVTIPSSPSLLNNWSFSFLVDNKATPEQIYKNQATVYTRNSFAGCSGYSRFSYPGRKFIVQFPIEYVDPKFRNENSFKLWETEMKILGSKTNYLGIHPYRGHLNQPVERWHNEGFYSTYSKYPQPEDFCTLTKDEWATWEVFCGDHILKTYHDFCLLRYLWSRHYHRLLDTYLDIRETDIDPFKALQMAHYSYDPDITRTRYYYSFCHLCLNDSVWKLITQEYFANQLLDKTRTLLNACFKERQLTNTYRNIYELIKDRDYKKVYDELTR